jgi:hypothetical protein
MGGLFAQKGIIKGDLNKNKRSLPNAAFEDIITIYVCKDSSGKRV